MTQPKQKPYAPKTKNNDWCGPCGGGGAWMERESPDKPLEYKVCNICGGEGVVAKDSPHARGARSDLRNPS